MSRTPKINPIDARNEVFSGARIFISKIIRTMAEIENGEYERKACDDNGISYSSFRGFIAKSQIASNMDACKDEQGMDSRAKRILRPYTWQEAFLDEMFGPERAKHCPSEFFEDAFYKHMPDSGVLTPQETVVMFFMYPMSLQQCDISRILGASPVTVRHWECTAKAKISERLFEIFSTGKSFQQPTSMSMEYSPKYEKHPLETALKELNLTAWPHNALRRNGFLSIESIENLSIEDLTNIKGIGPKSAKEIKSKIIEYNRRKDAV